MSMLISWLLSSWCCHPCLHGAAYRRSHAYQSVRSCTLQPDLFSKVIMQISRHWFDSSVVPVHGRFHTFVKFMSFHESGMAISKPLRFPKSECGPYKKWQRVLSACITCHQRKIRCSGMFNKSNCSSLQAYPNLQASDLNV